MNGQAATRIGLALGGGGVTGGAWLTGALSAIDYETGWWPGDATAIVGTSAGAVLSAVVAFGDRRHLASRSGRLDEQSPLLELAVNSTYRSSLRLGWGRPAAPRLLMSAVRERQRWPAALKALVALAPAGTRSMAPIRRAMAKLVSKGWVPHPACWITACDLGSGRRVVFGRDRVADLPEAVAASCAVPGYFEPVSIAGRRFVDGGVHSPTNLDLLGGLRLDLVVCLCPIPRLTPQRHALAPFVHAARQAALGQVQREADALRRLGTEVVLLTPEGDECAGMSIDFMDNSRSAEVLKVALESVRRRLRGGRLQGLLAGLDTAA